MMTIMKTAATMMMITMKTMMMTIMYNKQNTSMSGNATLIHFQLHYQPAPLAYTNVHTYIHTHIIFIMCANAHVWCISLHFQSLFCWHQVFQFLFPPLFYCLLAHWTSGFSWFALQCPIVRWLSYNVHWSS